jgi:hypothetical protein
MQLRTKTRGGAVIEAILIIAGLALMGKALMNGATSFKFTARAEPVDGIIASIMDYGFTAEIQFAAGPGGGQAFAQHGLFFTQQTGDHVPVIYESATGLAAVNRISALYFDSFEYGIPALFFLILGFRLRATRNI